MTQGAGLEGALGKALALLARRPQTCVEVREKLLEAGFAPAEAEAAVERLTDSGALDDARLASHFVLARSDRLGHGRGRLIADLVARGVDREVAERAWRDAVGAGDLDPEALLADEARRRVAAQGGRLDRKRHARVYNALLRAGFEPGAVEAALEGYRADRED